MFNLVKFTQSEYDNFTEYIRRNFNENYILTDKKYIDWQYDELILLKAKNEIVGHFGYKDVPYKIFDEVCDVRILMNLFIAEEYRLSGAAVLLAKEVFKANQHIMVSGYTQAASRLFKHLKPNWREAGNLSRYLKIFDPQAELLKGYGPVLLLNQKKTVQDASNSFTFSSVSARDISLLGRDFWLRARHRYNVTVERAESYLRWRFFNHPFLKYAVIVTKENNQITGYLIWRIEQSHNFKIARIIDFISLPRAEKSLLNKFSELVKKQKVAVADFMFSGNIYQDSLSKVGFFNVDGTDFEKFPILFNPVSTKKTFINIAYAFKASLNDCFFTKADGDQDRPNPC